MYRALVPTFLVFLAGPVLADTIGVKPGLWESKVINNVVDGRDMTAATAGAPAQLQQMMANMPPEQRAKIEAMMKQRGAPQIGADGAVQMCITPEMAGRDHMFIDREGRCQPAKIVTSGNHSTFDINCASNGTTTTGHGEATRSSDLIQSKVDMTSKNAAGVTHVMHIESEMKYLGADCGTVKPPPSPAAAKP